MISFKQFLEETEKSVKKQKKLVIRKDIRNNIKVTPDEKKVPLSNAVVN
jgi:hypothetical protein